jgi:hypothetical protein
MRVWYFCRYSTQCRICFECDDRIDPLLTASLSPWANGGMFFETFLTVHNKTSQSGPGLQLSPALVWSVLRGCILERLRSGIETDCYPSNVKIYW